MVADAQPHYCGKNLVKTNFFSISEAFFRLLMRG